MSAQPDTDPGIQKAQTPAQARMAKARQAKAEKAAADKIAAAAASSQAGVGAAPIQRRAAARTASQRAQTREPTRDPVRHGRVVVQGRDGEVLTRKRTSVGDIFHVPPELVPPGWTFQWVAVSVVGNTEILMDQNLQMAENGWRPVPAERYPGRFMPAGHKGNIIRGGQMLMERPEELTKEARREDIINAKQLISDRNDALKLSGVKDKMGPGYEMSQKYRGTGGRVQMSIDKGLYADEEGNIAKVPTPSYQIAGADE